MSAASAGKFQDHYAILGVDAKATSEVIQRAYSRLAEKYRPDNPETGDSEKFEAINLAYEVLSDGSLRREFDKLKGLDQDPEFQFTGSAFFSELSRGVNLRLALLCVLYDRRRLRPFTPALRCGSLKTSWRPPAKS
jgi:curved DNA-binding protein CbpA